MRRQLLPDIGQPVSGGSAKVDGGFAVLIFRYAATMREHPSRPDTSRVFFGLTVAAFGIAIALAKFDLLDRLGWTGSLFDYWPVLLILGGSVKLIAQPGERFSGLIIAGIGVILLLTMVTDQISWLDVLRFWPLVLVLVGLGMVFRALGRSTRTGWMTSEVQRIRLLGVLSAHRRQALSQIFEGADMVAIMGGCELDLKDARPIADGAVIDVVAVWGGIEILVPEDWRVDLRVTPIMGGAEDSTKRSGADGGHRLIVRGLALMGGIEVRN